MLNSQNTSQTDLQQVFKTLFSYSSAESYIESLEECFECFLGAGHHYVDEGHHLDIYIKVKELKEALAAAETIIEEAKNAPKLPPVTPPPTAPLKVFKVKGEMELTEERRAV